MPFDSLLNALSHCLGRRLSAAAVIAALGWTGAAHAADAEKVRFNEQIRPILSNRCYFCHGPDEKRREADLRLDTREGATADMGGYAAIVPGDPDASLVLERVTEIHDDEAMPPPEANKPRLNDEEVALLRRWIEQGAEYEGHWAFAPLAETAPPEVGDSTWVRNPIDNYILAKLLRRGMKPAAEADREILIRRVYLDLLGLVPPPEEVEAFAADPDPRAYEKLVDRLLASPHYGERWGRHWLDQARYADSHGYSTDGERQVWPYRDWVIQALNDDMPFDQFTIEQLAGDLLPKPTKSQLVATGFHRNTLINQEGGTDREQFRVESAMDRAETTGAVWLGLTVGCARCHTHKFDPITHQEYFQFYAFFNSTEDANNVGPTINVAEGEMLDGSSETAIASAEEFTRRRAAWEREMLQVLEARFEDQQQAKWTPARYASYQAASKASFQLLDDNSLLTDGRATANDAYDISAHTPLEQVAAVRLRVLTHPSLPGNGPGLASNGNFVLTDFQVSLGDTDLPIRTATADHEQPSYPVAHAIDDNQISGWAINVRPGSSAKMNADHEAVFVLDRPAMPAGEPLQIHLRHDLNRDYLIGRLAIEFSEQAPSLDTGEQDLLAALQADPAKRTAAQQALLQAAFELADPTARSVATGKAASANQMIMRERSAPRPTFLFIRGDFTRPNKELGPLPPDVFSAVAPPLPEKQLRNRLDLAQWLVDPRNPLTPRVTVNRVWMRYFGRGLAETEEDFGTQGPLPTHPELLDWLAAELIRRDWSLKQMHRLIVTSATYRQSSHVRMEVATSDPRNLLLARQQRLRLEGEIIRDAALTASGLLHPAIGGPSVYPPQPDGVYSFTQVRKRWSTDTGPNRYRRGMYTFFFRSSPYPLLTTFDAPDFQSVCTRRGRSNTPLQSLTLANDQAFVEIARGLAARLVRDVQADDDHEQLDARIDRAFLVCLSRQPTKTERQVLSAYYRRQQQAFADDLEAARQLAPLGLGQGIDPADAAALVCLARVILNTDNFITRE